MSGGRLKLAAAALLVVAYAFAVHYANGPPAQGRVGAALAVLPLVALLADVLRRLRRPLAVASGLAAIAATAFAWRALETHFDRLLLAQQALAYFALGGLFAASLLPRRTPLCTGIALTLQGAVDAATRRYTRQVTLAWALLLLAIAITMSILYGLHLTRAWSLFANFGPLILLPTMFIVELQVRRRRLPHAPRPGPLQVLRAWWARDAVRRR
jgi:uncharacterized membrane protein